MQIVGMMDWYRVWAMVVFTVAALAGFVAEIMHFCQAGF
jgi:hypothetical protein